MVVPDRYRSHIVCDVDQPDVIVEFCEPYTIADRRPPRLTDAGDGGAVSTAVEQNAESARTTTCPVAPTVRATPIASATSPAAPRGGAGVPTTQPGSRTTGAASGVQMVATSGDNPRRSTGYPPAFA